MNLLVFPLRVSHSGRVPWLGWGQYTPERRGGETVATLVCRVGQKNNTADPSQGSG